MTEYLTPEELVDRYRGAVTLGTLANWRASGTGPAYTKIGKAVLYRRDLLEQWEQQHLRPHGAGKLKPKADAA